MNEKIKLKLKNDVIWRVIDDFPDYEISNYGWVRSFGHILKNQLVRQYPHVMLSNQGKKGGRYVHRLVAQAFIPNPNNYETVDHIDFNPSNNFVNNLQWMTNIDNAGRHHRRCAKSQYLFVTPTGKKFRVRMRRINMDRSFDTEIEAAEYANKLIIEYGLNCPINIIQKV